MLASLAPTKSESYGAWKIHGPSEVRRPLLLVYRDNGKRG